MSPDRPGSLRRLVDLFLNNAFLRGTRFFFQNIRAGSGRCSFDRSRGRTKVAGHGSICTGHYSRFRGRSTATWRTREKRSDYAKVVSLRTNKRRIKPTTRVLTETPYGHRVARSIKIRLRQIALHIFVRIELSIARVRASKHFRARGRRAWTETRG